ncbi:MAG: S9 family peptidase [Terriglobales bacterium]
MRHLCFLLLVSSLALPLLAQTKRPFTFEDMMLLKRIAEPSVSPDGKWVVFSAVDVDLSANTKTPHIWIVPTAGGQEREIISSQDADRPRWAPDGKRFAFISTKEGGSQVWVADFDGGAGTVTGVHRLTSIATEAGGELWSPDGKNILFVSNVYPECAGEACNAKQLEEAENSKVKALIFTRLLYRHWNHYAEGRRSHLLIIPAEGGVSRDLTPGDYEAPVFSLGGQDDYAFSPDGQEVCYTSNHDPVEATSTNNDLWIVPVDRGQASSPVAARNITADNPASDSTPLYSPDGKYIAYRAQVRPGYEADRFRLILYERKTGEKKDLTEDFDRWVGNLVWAPDSRTIYLTAEHEGHSLIYAVETTPAAGTGKARFSRRVLVGGYNDALAVTPDGKKLVFDRMSISAPNEIYASETAGDGCPARTGEVDDGKWDCSLNKDWAITRLNERVLSQVSMSKIESFSFAGASGDDVEGFIVRPPNFDPGKKYPVKFILHGGPQVPMGDEWSYRWNSELFAAGGSVVIMINFHGSPGYGQKFIDAINGDWGGAPFEDLMKGLDYAEQHYPFIDKDRECALGASYGGYMANWILGHSNRFKCIVSHDGQFNTESAWGTTEELWFPDWEFRGTPYTNREMYRKWSPHLSATNFKTPTLVVHGQRDYRLDVSEGFQLFTTLQMLGVPSKMLYFPDEGHWVLKPQNSQLWYKTVDDWIDQWTKK